MVSFLIGMYKKDILDETACANISRNGEAS